MSRSGHIETAGADELCWCGVKHRWEEVDMIEEAREHIGHYNFHLLEQGAWPDTMRRLMNEVEDLRRQLAWEDDRAWQRVAECSWQDRSHGVLCTCFGTDLTTDEREQKKREYLDRRELARTSN